MTNWRRAFLPGGTFFFTLVTEHRQPILTTLQARPILRSAISECRRRWPFGIEAMVLLPDHLHAVWCLPENDGEFSKRWGWIKKEFTKSWLATGGLEQPVSGSRWRNRRRGVFQRRFWEHMIRDETDFRCHIDYIHYNPVKHGLVQRPDDWPWSSFHRYVGNGIYPENWACDVRQFEAIESTVGE